MYAQTRISFIIKVGNILIYILPFTKKTARFEFPFSSSLDFFQMDVFFLFLHAAALRETTVEKRHSFVF